MLPKLQFNEGAVDDLCLNLALVIFDHSLTAEDIPPQRRLQIQANALCMDGCIVLYDINYILYIIYCILKTYSILYNTSPAHKGHQRQQRSNAAGADVFQFVLSFVLRGFAGIAVADGVPHHLDHLSKT